MPTIKSISVLLRVIGVSSETGAPSFYPTCPMNRVGSLWQIAVAGLSIGECNNTYVKATKLKQIGHRREVQAHVHGTFRW
jgi:hypothetical protein